MLSWEGDSRCPDMLYQNSSGYPDHHCQDHSSSWGVAKKKIGDWMHTDRCRFAKSKKKKCRCSCEGILHGLEELNSEIDNGEEYISEFETLNDMIS